METVSTPNTFLGVRFVLFGTDPFNQRDVRSMLVDGGGVDVGQYSQDCTHVIVDNIIYDDPVCIAARNDGKIIVTALWVHHSFHIGIPVDPTSIMYRPLQDLNGIPGAKSLVVCLTGYQRQDREDIMTMVGLMGAQFSKPLVANKVTHLICYKFEGEKYDLAKKMKKIKLVNHRWLEDCLRDWELLPEANYDKSGYELEMMEAEAKDSEDEAEGSTLKQFGGKDMNNSPHYLKVGMPSARESPKSAIQVPPVPADPLDVVNAEDMLSTPGKMRISDQTSIIDKVDVPVLQGCRDTGTYRDALHESTSNSTKVKNDLASTSKDMEMLSHSGSKFCSVSYSRKTPQNSILSMSSRKVTDKESGSPQANLGVFEVDDDARDITSSIMEKADARIVKVCRGTPQKGGDVCHEEGSSGMFSRKRMTDISSASSESRTKSQYMSRNVKASNMGSPVVNYKTQVLEPNSSVCHLLEINNYLSVGNNVHYTEEAANLEAAPNSHTTVSTTSASSLNKKPLTADGVSFKTMTSETGQNEIADKKRPGTSFGGLKESNLASNPDIVDFEPRPVHLLGEAGEPQNQQHDIEVSAPNSRGSVMDKSNRPVNVDSLHGENDKLTAKPHRKKMVAKKTLGSRYTANQKGSVYLNKIASLNDPTVSLSGGKEGVDQEKFSGLEASPPTSSVEAVKELDTNFFTIGEDDNICQTEFMDDETEAPDEKDEHEIEKAPNDEKSVVVELTPEEDTMMKRMPGVGHEANNSNTRTRDEIAAKEMMKGSEVGKTVCGKKFDLDESTSKGEGMKEKTYSGKKQSSGKAKTKNVLTDMDDETEAPDKKDEHEFEKALNDEKFEMVELTREEDTMMKRKPEVRHEANDHSNSTHEELAVKRKKGTKVGKTVCGKKFDLDESTSKGEGMKERIFMGKKRSSGKAKAKNVLTDMDDEIGAPDQKDEHEFEKALNDEKSDLVGLTHEDDTMMKRKPGVRHEANDSAKEGMNATKVRKTVCGKKFGLDESTSKQEGMKGKIKKGKRWSSGKAKENNDHADMKTVEPEKDVDGERTPKNKIKEKKIKSKKSQLHLGSKTSGTASANKLESFVEVEKENRPVVDGDPNSSLGIQFDGISDLKSMVTPKKVENKIQKVNNSNSGPAAQVLSRLQNGPAWFILSGHRLQRKEFQLVIKRLKGRCCRDSHQWSYQATHFIAPEPIRRTEKFFAAAASGRWILKTDYLSACSLAGKFLAEEPYEWHKVGVSEDGAIDLEAPRKWRLLRERTGHGAFYGMRVIVYGECIAPPLDTLKRAVKAGDGELLATSPPYTRFLKSGVDFAIVSPGMPHVDMWVQEFLKHEIPCVVADYLVEFVCKPGHPLEKHVLFNTHAWAAKSLANMLSKAEAEDNGNDLICQVCGASDRGEVMLICGNESGSVGCGVGTHIDCCDPPLENVPEEDWFCSECSRSNINPSKKRKKRNS